MRILAVTNMYPTSQEPFSGIFVEQQVKGLKENGLDVGVMFLDRFQIGRKVYLGSREQIVAWIRRFQPDIVHVMYGGVMADQVTRVVQDRPTVVTFHGSDLLGQQLSGPLERMVAGYGVWASWRAALRANGIVVVSKILEDALPTCVDTSKVRIIPCGIDLARFKPLDRDKCRRELGWSPEIFHVLFPSHRENAIKRYDLAQAAVKLLSNRRNQLEMHELQGISNEEVPLWLNACDVLLLTSLHEGSPTIIKEALACNVPVVSVDVGDVRERIEGIEGCHLASPEPSDLAAKLQLVYNGMRRVAGRNKIHELSLQRIALRLREFYTEVLVSFRPRVKKL